MDENLEKAKELVQQDMKERGEKASKEVEQVLIKYNCTLQIGEKGIFIQPNL